MSCRSLSSYHPLPRDCHSSLPLAARRVGDQREERCRPHGARHQARGPCQVPRRQDHLPPQPLGPLRHRRARTATPASLDARSSLIRSGGWGAHGGARFSARTPPRWTAPARTSVRQAAKSIVAAGRARRGRLSRCRTQSGVPRASLHLRGYLRHWQVPDKEILQLVKENFDFRPGMMAQDLDLTREATRGTRRRRPAATSAAVTPTSPGRSSSLLPQGLERQLV